MDEKQRGIQFALKRSQAGRNAETRAASILFNAAKKVIAESKTHISPSGGMTRETDLISKAQGIMASTAGEIEAYVKAYSEASSKILGIGNGVIDDYLAGNIYGQTFASRNSKYLSQFAEDIVKMIKAGALMGYSDDKILSAVRTGYKNPYATSIITKAQKQDINIANPSYGRGFYKSAYQNLMRNVRGTIALAWGKAEQEYGKEIGAIGYKVYRGSSYLCDICDELTIGIHPIGEVTVPAHINCRCFIVFVFENDDNKD